MVGRLGFRGHPPLRAVGRARRDGAGTGQSADQHRHRRGSGDGHVGHRGSGRPDRRRRAHVRRALRSGGQADDELRPVTASLAADVHNSTVCRTTSTNCCSVAASHLGGHDAFTARSVPIIPCCSSASSPWASPPAATESAATPRSPRRQRRKVGDPRQRRSHLGDHARRGSRRRTASRRRPVQDHQRRLQRPVGAQQLLRRGRQDADRLRGGPRQGHRQEDRRRNVIPGHGFRLADHQPAVRSHRHDDGRDERHQGTSAADRLRRLLLLGHHDHGAEGQPTGHHRSRHVVRQERSRGPGHQPPDLRRRSERQDASRRASPPST